MADLQKIADELSTLTVIEAAELAKILEEVGCFGRGAGRDDGRPGGRRGSGRPG